MYEQFVAPGLKQAGAEARKVPQIKLFLEKVDAFTVRSRPFTRQCSTTCSSPVHDPWQDYVTCCARNT